MANLKDKDINDLSTWNMKELRKLKINANNRIESIKSVRSARELTKSHILYGMEVSELEELVLNIKRAEKKLAE